MPQTPEGAIKVNARKAGVSVRVYLQKLKAGLKWCYHCKAFQSVAEFGSDSSRYDGLTALCSKARNERQRKLYVPVPPETIKHGPAPHPPRENDKLQARQRINVLVRTGKLPNPSTLPCTDCGHLWKKGDKRHEYDHYLGYNAAHHYDVQPVCTRCHCDREMKRGSWGKQKSRGLQMSGTPSGDAVA
jgi:hypothetical protein